MLRLILIGAGVVVLLLPAVATSRIASNTLEPAATLSKKGLRAEAGVLLGCDREQRARVRVTVTLEGDAEGPGAVAQGRRTVACTTEQKRFGLKVTARANRRLVAGEAIACALAVTSDDARQWCKEITLE